MEALALLAVVVLIGLPVWLILYLKKLGVKNLENFATEHGLVFTRKDPPLIAGDISGRAFEYAGAFTKRRGVPFELWSVKLKTNLPPGLAVIPSGFFSSIYPFPKGSVVLTCIEELRSRFAQNKDPESECVRTDDKKFDRNLVVVCDDHDAARRYLTPERRKVLLDLENTDGFLFDSEVFIEKEQSACRAKVLNKHLMRLLGAAEALDAVEQGSAGLNQTAGKFGNAVAK